MSGLKTDGKILSPDAACYRLLERVYGDEAYGSIELNRALFDVAPKDRAFVTGLFYGVLEKDVTLDYLLKQAADKNPKRPVRIVLKMGLYLLRYSEVPSYAAVDRMVALTQEIGKRELKGFVNAVLRRADKLALPDPQSDKTLYLSVRYSLPRWLVCRLLAEKGEAFIRAYYGEKRETRPHVRVNRLKTGEADFYSRLTAYDKTETGCYADYAALKQLDQSWYAVQSLASTLTARFYAHGLAAGDRALDLCAAPGGKAVYLYELTGADITACDIHPHRIELIRSYAARMGARLDIRLNDAAVYRPELADRFKAVLCDVPCSGLGVASKKPDIYLKRTEADIAALAELQYKILTNAARYVTINGQLDYSTCTILAEENEAVAVRFLAEHPHFRILPIKGTDEDGYLRLYPHTAGTDGFFAVKFVRLK